MDSLIIANDNDWAPSFKPHTEAKMCYDDRFLYIIFKVQDQYVKCVTGKRNGPVWQDACVEFFFAPDVSEPLRYFNIEVNCAGVAYMAYQKIPRIDFDLFAVADIESTKIAHSLTGLIREEIEHPLEWTIGYRLPFEMLARYAEFPCPTKGSVWKANFFKCAENNSHPHWLSWTKIIDPEPDFHRSQFFGTLVFA